MAGTDNGMNLSKDNTAHLFPAFVPEYLGIESHAVKSYGINLHEYLEKASEITGTGLIDFNITNNNFLDDLLKSQYIAYIFSCCVSDILHNKGRRPEFVTSYSMGIYAAFYHCRSIDFSTGLIMIRSIFESIEKNLPAEPSSMCVIGGLSREDVTSLLRSFQADVYIVNQNSEFSFLLSGNKSSLEKILHNAALLGALQTRMLPVSHPYHSPELKNASTKFYKALQTLAIGNNKYDYISAIDNKIIITREDIIAELTNNIFLGFDWYKTIKYLLNRGISTFIECGAGENLYKIGKFIEGDFKIYNLKKIHQLC